MTLVERVHGSYVAGRRAKVLSRHLAKVIPEKLHVLDVGCGDGLIDRLIHDQRPDLELRGVDVLVRPKSFIPVAEFDGTTLPHADASFDCVMFVDVLHHMVDPMIMLREATRVARGPIIIKDHAREGFLAALTLRVMDEVGNRRHGVPLPHNYWATRQWSTAWENLQLRPGLWMTRLDLYPWPANWLFDRRLHFIARLDRI
jgi:SAM-dependent methyltransferase